MKKIALILLIGLVAISGAFADDGMLHMRHIGFKHFDPIYLATMLGYFEEEGIDMEILDMNIAGPQALQAVDVGDAETTTTSNVALINGVYSGLKVTAITDLQTAQTIRPIEKFYVRAEDNINSVKDLKGKVIGINLVKSSFHYTWLMMLDRNGMIPEDVVFVQIPFAQLPEALVNGVVDAIGVLTPYDALADKMDGLEILFTDVDAFGGENQFSTCVVSSDFMNEHADMMDNFMRAVCKAITWANSNPKEASKLIGKWANVDPALIYDYKFVSDGMIWKDSLIYWRDFLSELEGIIPADFDVEKCYTNRFNPNYEG